MLPMNFFKTFAECSLPSKHSRLRNVMGQSYPIYTLTRANHAGYSLVHDNFAVARNSLLKQYLEKKT